MPEEQWTEACHIVQEAVIKTISKGKEWKKPRWLFEEVLQIAKKKKKKKKEKKEKREAKAREKRKDMPS